MPLNTLVTMLMRSDELALLGTEIKRRLLSRQFVFVLAVMTFFAWGTITQMIVFQADTQVGYNAWDVFLGVFGNTASSLTSTVIFPVLLVFLLGSGVQEDVLSGYSLVVQARLERKNSYWWIKVLAILAVLAVVIASLYVIALLLGAARGFAVLPAVLSRAGGHPNAWAITRGVPPIYYSLPKGANVVAHGLLVAAYFVFAYFAVVMFVVGVTVRSKNLYTPLAFGALVTTSQLAVSYAAQGFAWNFNLVSALTESSHRKLPALTQPMESVVPWVDSIILLLGLMVVGIIVGTLLTPTRVRGVARKTAPAALAVTVFLLLAATLLTGCTSLMPKGVSYERFIHGTMPKPPKPMKLSKLSTDDTKYLKAVARKTVHLGDALVDLHNLFGPRYLHSSDEAISALLKERLAAIDGDLKDIRALRPTPALAGWYRKQYEPGIAELQYLVDNLGPLYAKRDHVGVRMSLKHTMYADVYFSAAGETIAPFAPKAVKGAIGND